jgi:hypothetical protein
MTGKKETGPIWNHTTVVLRSDIYRQALERGIDISDVCNRALAALTGSGYSRQQLEEIPAPPPVIIAKDGSSPHTSEEPKKGISQKLHPVINADDPAAPAKVVQAKTPLKKAPAELPTPLPVPAPAIPKEIPVAAPAASLKKVGVPKGRDAPAKKRTKGDALKSFFSSKIARMDDAEATISKDEFYELFTRFCRDHHMSPVPERKAVTIALKNQFALTEKVVDGTACWTGIRLK